MALARFNFALQDSAGNVVNNASVEVRRESDNALVQVFSDRNGATPLGNPFTAADGASVGFHVAGGAYKITATQGAFSREWRYVAIGLGAETDFISAPGLQFLWDTGTSDADPGGGDIRANNATLSSATFLYVSKTNRAGSDVSAYLLGLTGKQIILGQDNSASQVVWTVGAVTNATGYVKLGLTSHSGVTSIAAGTVIGLQNFGTPGVSGVSALTVVRLVATSNVVIASALENGDTIDGVVLATGNFVLLTGQTAPAENGLYTVPASGAASRTTNFTTYDAFPGTMFSVMEGTVNADTLWRGTSNRGGTIGVTALVISKGLSAAETPLEFNWTFNSSFEIWGGAAAAAPTSWTLAGAGVTVAKNTSFVKFGAASAALTRAGTDCRLLQEPHAFRNFGPIAAWQGMEVTFGCWIRTDTAGTVRLGIEDGVAQTDGAFHNGDATFQFFTVTRTINAAATRVRIQLEIIGTNCTAYFDGAVLVRAPSVSVWRPSGWIGRSAAMSAGMSEADAVQATNTTRYYNSAGNYLTEVRASGQRVPFKCVVRNLDVHSSAVPGAAQTFTYTLRSALTADLSVTCQIAGAGADTASDQTNEAEVAKGTAVTLKVVASNGAAAVRHGGSWELEEVP